MSDHDSRQGSDVSSDEWDTVRPNRYVGPSSTWQSLTEQERGLAASLDALRNQDLSIHLYNAHRLKKRGRVLDDSKNVEAESTRSQEDEDAVESASQKAFVPPKLWTAWPLKPEEVPREGEHVGPEDEDEIYTFKRRDYDCPSRVLEDVLVGMTLRLVKERFAKREWDLDMEEKAEEVVMNMDMEQTASMGNEGSRDSGNSGEASDRSLGQGEVEVEHLLKQQSEPLPEFFCLKPTVSADDDGSQRILRPSIRHILSKLDDVLMALHHARRTCHEYSRQSESGIDDCTHSDSAVQDKLDVKNEEMSIKKRRGRPRKHTNLPERPRLEGSKSDDHNNDIPELWRSKMTHRGRPKKLYERLEGETQQDYLVRVARLQKKPLPAFAPSLARGTPEIPSPAVKKIPRKNRATSHEANVRRQRFLGLRDWSEVIGSAALVGFSPEVIALAAKRCANLFGEGMAIRTMVETPASVKDADHVEFYVPEEIPKITSDSDEGAEMSEDNRDGSNETGSGPDDLKSDTWKIGTRKPKGLAARKEACFCPILECPRHTHGFSSVVKLRKHLRMGHRMTQEEADEALVDSDDEIGGAVHIDGFLKPIRAKRGWRGKDTKERKKGRWQEEVREDESSAESNTKLSAEPSFKWEVNSSTESSHGS